MKKILTLTLCICTTFIGAYSQTCQNAGLGTNTPGSKLEIRGCTNSSSTSALNVTDSNASSIFYIRNDHAIGINTTSPASLFSVGSSNQFQVNSSGNLISINNVTYSWPTTQGGANSVLGNNGSGTLSWLSANGTAWLISGNTGTSPSTNFLGNKDSVDLVFRTNNIERMRIAAKGGGVGIGTAPATNTIMNIAQSANATSWGLQYNNTNTGTSTLGGILIGNGTQNLQLQVWGTGSTHSHPFAANDVNITSSSGAMAINGYGNLFLSVGGLSAAGNSLNINSAGNVQIGIGAVNQNGCQLSLVAGTTANAPLLLNSGTLNTTAQAGAMEYTSPEFYLTPIASNRGIVEVIPAHADLTGQTGAVSTVTSFATTALSTWRIGGYINITAISTDQIQASVTYTDENSNSETLNLTGILTGTGDVSFTISDIRVKASTTITIKTTLTTGGGTITYDVGGTITRLY